MSIITKQNLADFLNASRAFVVSIAEAESLESKAFIATQYALLNKANESIMSGLLQVTSKEDTQKLIELFDEAANDLKLSDEEFSNKLTEQEKELANTFAAPSTIKVEA